MYYNPQSIANLLSIYIVTYKYRVTIDIGVEDAIVVQLEKNQGIKFTCCGHGLHDFNAAKSSPTETHKDNITENETIDKFKSSFTGYSFFYTVAANKEYFTQHEI